MSSVKVSVVERKESGSTLPETCLANLLILAEDLYCDGSTKAACSVCWKLSHIVPGKRSKFFKIQVVTRRIILPQETKDTVLALFNPMELPSEPGWS